MWTFLGQIEAKLELRLEHVERDERLNVFDREELRFNLFREVFEETALELKVHSTTRHSFWIQTGNGIILSAVS